MRVKLFRNSALEELEKEINKFLEDRLNVVSVDFKVDSYGYYGIVLYRLV